MADLPAYRASTIPKNAKKVFEGVIFDVYQWEQELYDGSYTTFEKLARPDTATVFPVLEDGRILLVEDTQPTRETTLRAPTGRVEPGETPEEAAKRELLEETGYEIGELSLLDDFSPNEKIDYRIYDFIGHRCKKIKEPQPEAGEKIVPRPVTFDQLIDLSFNGEFEFHDFSVEVLHALLNPKKMDVLRKKFMSN